MVIIINTGIGNFKSIQNMLLRIGIASTISSDPEVVLKAEKIIIPGIGSYDQGMAALENFKLIEPIKYKATIEKTKILGICLGMQLLGELSEEGQFEGLALIKGKVKKFKNDGNNSLRIPHMGWNYVCPKKDSVLFNNFTETPRFYFTHSYYFECVDSDVCIAQTPYGINFSSAVQYENIVGVQFHPEKSHRFGLQFLSNFASW